ncbi:hypothetical protein M422DRAFT_260609 [Sphaerobolus stellatus SS14]|uniref:CCHC-type domain-containing protein n=1 Tax=Sphaerobolus stellatus (strain SS14) TaxID=990650 RepID=A0A0C9U2F1_SPHS4|nr:hypothetical protein M422DRAFT_260609 [Sphaerobolus stellatus SS14]
MTAQLDVAVVNRMTEYGGIQQMVRQAVQNTSHEAEPEKLFLAKASVKMGNPPTYSGECNLEKFENWVVSVLQFMSMYNLLGPQVGKVQLQFLGQCLTGEAQEWFYWQVEWFDQEIKHWDLESIIMELQKWFMLTLSMNKVAVNYDTIMHGSMIMQQFHQELLKLPKQMIELQDFSGKVLPLSSAVTFDNAKHYTLSYNSNHGSSYVQKAATMEHSHAQHTATQNNSMNQNAGSSNQHKSGNKPIQSHQTTQLLSTGGGDVRVNPTYGKNPAKLGNIVNKPIQSNPIRTASKANNTVVCYNCNQPGHIRPNCPFPDKDKRVAGARIEEVILEEFDEDTPHPEEQQDLEDQPEDDQQYHFDDDEYKTRSIDNEVKAETDLRVSAVVQTGEKEQPVYDH